jgi:hypothetical protein
MADVHYVVVEHDGGWAYKLGDVFSETFRTRDEAHNAAEVAAEEQRRGGDDAVIEYQDERGKWRTEAAKGTDRPTPDVED